MSKYRMVGILRAKGEDGRRRLFVILSEAKDLFIMRATLPHPHFQDCSVKDVSAPELVQHEFPNGC